MFIKQPFEGISKDMAEKIIKEAGSRLRSELFRDGKWYADCVRICFKAKK